MNEAASPDPVEPFDADAELEAIIVAKLAEMRADESDEHKASEICGHLLKIGLDAPFYLTGAGTPEARFCCEACARMRITFDFIDEMLADACVPVSDPSRATAGGDAAGAS